MAKIDEVLDEAKAAGVSEDVAKNFFYAAVQKDPSFANLDARQIVQGAKATAETMSGSKAPLQQLQQVSINAPRAKLPTTVNPYAGTTQEERNPETPNAASISQFDPEALKAAQAQFNQRYADTQGMRTAMNTLAGLGLGSSGGKTTEYNNQLNDLQLKNMWDQTLGAQGRLQSQATAGEAALTSAQAREVGAGEFMAAQRKKQNELDLQSYDVATRKKLNDPNSNQSKIAKEMFSQQITVGGKAPTAAQLEMLKNATAEEIMGYMDPKVMDAFKARAGLAKSAAETAAAYGQAYQSTGEGGRIRAATPGVAATSDITRAAAASTIGDDGKLIPMPGSNRSIQAGPLAITPSQLTTGQQAAGADAASTDLKQSTIASNTRMDTLSTDLIKVASLGDPSPTGLTAKWQARFTPGQKEQARARLDQLVSSKMQYEAAAGLNTIKDKDAEVDRMSQLSRGAFQSEMARLNEQLTRQQEMLKERNAYQQANGTSAGFNPSVVDRKTYLINPKTGQAIFDSMTPQQVKEANAKGFVTPEDINKIGMK